MDMSRVVSCPHCGQGVEWTPASRYRPFCSERCKLIDFGAWATEKYCVPETEGQDQFEDAAPGIPPAAT